MATSNYSYQVSSKRANTEGMMPQAHTYQKEPHLD